MFHIVDYIQLQQTRTNNTLLNYYKKENKIHFLSSVVHFSSYKLISQEADGVPFSRSFHQCSFLRVSKSLEIELGTSRTVGRAEVNCAILTPINL